MHTHTHTGCPFTRANVGWKGANWFSWHFVFMYHICWSTPSHSSSSFPFLSREICYCVRHKRLRTYELVIRIYHGTSRNTPNQSGRKFHKSRYVAIESCLHRIFMSEEKTHSAVTWIGLQHYDPCPSSNGLDNTSDYVRLPVTRIVKCSAPPGESLTVSES